MPGVYHQPVSRREFLKTTFVAGAAVVLHGCQGSPGGSATGLVSEGEIHLALLSDTHVGPGERAKDKRGFDPCAQLRRVVPDIIAGSPRGSL